MKDKHIILTVTNDLTYDRRMFRICTALAAANADVTLVGRRLKSSQPFHPPGFKGMRIKCWFNKGFLFYCEYNTRLFFYLLNQKFDVLCACDLDTALPVTLAIKFKLNFLFRRSAIPPFRLISVYDAHEFFTEVPEIVNRPFVKKIWEWIGWRTIPYFDLRYTVGEELAILMGKKYKVPFHVVRNIPSVALHRDVPAANRFTTKILFYQGALNVGRGLEAILQAMTQLSDWEFRLAGEGDITDQLKNLAKEYQIEERVKFLGWVLPDDLPGLMRDVTLGINLREEGSLNDYYSLPNKFFDFIHAGLPSINMNYPEYKRVCEKYLCTMLISEVSASKIVKTIHWIENNPAKYDKMIVACKEASKEFTWEKEKEKLISLYLRLI